MTIERRVFFSRVAVRLMLAAGSAALMAGCSDASRFAENPFSDPFGSSSHGVDRAPTGSVSKPPRSDLSPIQSRPLPPPSAGPSASAAPRPSRPPILFPLKARRPARRIIGVLKGGTPVVVAQGETASTIASRYGVPTDAVLRVNGFASAQQVQPGARLVIPVYHAVAAHPAASGAKSADAVSKKTPSPKAQLNKRAEEEKPGRKSKDTRAEAKSSAEKLKLAKAKDAEVKPAAAKAKLAKVEESAPKPAEKFSKATETADAGKTDKTPTSSIPSKQEEKVAAADSQPEFRWPARGRIIQGFSSGGNDGINISVPEGTQVKAAENGVVAYAGNELKGYGNLVLIRHPNGFVSAYAHNGQLDVKRGDQVKRGQTIARSGQSGNVGSPQLHFELRKGSTPVDPTNYLAGL